MKSHNQHIRRILVPVMGVSLFVVSVALSGPTNTTAGASKTKASESGAKDKSGTQTAKLETPKSTFYIPNDQKELKTNKDPFFPRSLYPITIKAPQVANNNTNPHPVVVTTAPELTLSGLSGTEEKPYAIINYFTFGVGDERDVAVTPGKPKVKIRCVEIHLADQTVVVSVGGRLQTLSLKKK